MRASFDPENRRQRGIGYLIFSQNDIQILDPKKQPREQIYINTINYFVIERQSYCADNVLADDTCMKQGRD